MPFTPNSPEIALQPEPTQEVNTLTGLRAEVINERYIQLLEEKALAYKGSIALHTLSKDPLSSTPEKQNPQIASMREFVHTLQERNLLLRYTQGRFSIDTSSLPPSVLPEGLKKRVEDVMDTLYGKTNPVPLGMESIPAEKQRDRSTTYNANVETITNHMQQACVELLAYSNPDAKILDTTFSKLDIPGTVRDGTRNLTLEDIYNALRKKAERTTREKQFLISYEATISQGKRNFSPNQKSEKEAFLKNMQEKRTELEKSLGEISDQLEVTKETQKSTVNLAKGVMESIGIDTGNMTTVNKNLKDWSWDDALNTVKNTILGGGQVANNMFFNLTHDPLMAFDNVGKIFLTGLGILGYVLGNKWTFGLGKYFTFAALANIASNYATGGKNSWEILKETAQKTSEYTISKNDHQALTIDQQNTIKKMPLNKNLWESTFGLSKEDAPVIATLMNVPMESMFNAIGYDEKKGDIIYSEDMFTKDEKALLKKLPSFNSEQGVRKLLKEIFKRHGAKIQALFPQYPAGEGVGQYTEEFVVMKYLTYRYDHAFTKGQERQTSDLSKYDKTTTFKSILEYEFEQDDNTYKVGIEREFYQKFPSPVVQTPSLETKVA